MKKENEKSSGVKTPPPSKKERIQNSNGKPSLPPAIKHEYIEALKDSDLFDNRCQCLIKREGLHMPARFVKTHTYEIELDVNTKNKVISQSKKILYHTVSK